MTQESRNTTAFLLAYIALIVYGTWFPIERWDWSAGGWQAFLAMDWPARIPRSDLIINLVVYLPLGLLIGISSRSGMLHTVIKAMCGALLLSSCLEYGQTFLSGRISSGSDIILNTLGSAIGALGTGAIMRSRWIRARYQAVAGELRKPGKGHLGLTALVLWVLSQWAPFVPSLDFDNLKRGLAPFKAFVAGTNDYFIYGCIEYLAMLTGLLALGLRLFKNTEQASIALIFCMFTVLSGKILIMTRQLAPEALIAAVCASIIALWLRQQHSSMLKVIAFFSLLIYQVVASLTPGIGDPALRQMNWVPFRGQMNSVSGIIDLIEPLWLFAAYAYLMYPRHGRSTAGLALRLVIIAPLALLLEWGQQLVPGRYPDITDVVVAVCAFALAYSFPWRRFSNVSDLSDNRRRVFAQIGWRRSAGSVAILLICFFLFGQLTQTNPYSRHRLPEIDELATPSLAGFNYRHPRLPAPNQSDWRDLARENPLFIEQKRADSGAGDLVAQITLARMEPESVGLNKLFNRLIALEFSGLGDKQSIPISLAYDWLYDDWTPTQRGLLLAKTDQACRYQAQVIRTSYQLSPYNQVLYRGPLQAVMMASLAVHGDSRDGECMRFAYDYWKNRVLPVWRQVMGRRGGWHEGGEHLGLGVGRAVYSVPAMWRKATGEDLFSSISGLRGFLDFAIYRMRPDGTQVRLGDISKTKTAIPDLAALALEFKHPAAYTAANPPTKLTPLGFPWGPMSDSTLLDPQAINRLPRMMWFDGIGLLVARSDWSDTATYLAAKAGNNYWSHTHLDQGGFTLFKGEALAIDSGVVFDVGGSHHMNYAYQSVAHNVVTLTDADDATSPPVGTKLAGARQPKRQPPRRIANDGGQRRVGSGWGRPAPLDLQDWMAQSQHYQTVGASLGGSNAEGSMFWMNADLTPAYNNGESRKGTFSARTHRVDQYLRSIVYLRDADLILVHDRLQLSKSGLRSRWLLHSQRAAEVTGQQFAIRGQTASLLGEVLLPQRSTLLPVGGRGFEFFVENQNYDQNGAALNAAKKNKSIEAGSWRLEIMPESDGREIQYLVALRPTLNKTEGHTRLSMIRQKAGIQVSAEDFGLTVFLPSELAKPNLTALAPK